MFERIQIENFVFNLSIEHDDKTIVSSCFHIQGQLPAQLTEEQLKSGHLLQQSIFKGEWNWLIQKSGIITLPTHNIVVTLVDPHYTQGSLRYGGGNISSTLKETCPYCQDTDCNFDCPDAMEYTADRDMGCQNDKNEELESHRNYNFACDAIEAMVLGHAIAGVNIEAAAYLEGLESAIDGCANNI